MQKASLGDVDVLKRGIDNGWEIKLLPRLGLV